MELTVHWVRGGYYTSEDDVLELVSELTAGGYGESLDWGRFMYRRQHRFVAGLTVYVDPRADNMPPVLVECPGTACEFLGLEKIRVLFCNAQLSRVDLAFDHQLFTPAEAAEWARAGNVRTRAKRIRFDEKVKGEPSEGDKLTVGSRASEQYLRVYDKRGFTRVELELKGEMARAFHAVLLDEDEALRRRSTGVLREFVDFVDASRSANISRAPLLRAWETFVGDAERTRLRIAGSPSPTVDRVVRYIEHQVAATLYTYGRLGYSFSGLLRKGKSKLKSRHRSVLAFAGAT